MLLTLIPSKRFRLFDSLQKYGLKNNVKKLKYYQYRNLETLLKAINEVCLKIYFVF